MSLRINPYSLTRPEAVTETRVFTDPVNPGAELSLTLSAKGGFNDLLEIGKAGSKLVRDYVTGVTAPSETQGAPPVVKEPPTPLSFPGFGSFKASETLCHIIAQIMHLQVTEDGETPYDFAEWCIISETMPTAFGKINDWSERLLSRVTVEAKNDSGASTAA